MPTLMQKIRLAIKGWNRRREERDKEFLAKNTWSAPAAAPAARTATAPKQLDIEGLTVAYLDDSGRIDYYLDMTSGDVVESRGGPALPSDRYKRIPARSSESEHDDRRTFVDSLDPSPIRKRLAASTAAPETFRRELSQDRAVERAWYNFKNDRALAAIEKWLREMGMR